jgi:bifunctional lysine-specific demethylase and histidyl-hydroxylase MINA
MKGLKLAHLLAPISVEQFMERYWGRMPLVVQRHAPELFAALPDSDEFDFLLHSLTNPQGGWFSVVRDVARPPADALLTQEGLLNLSEVYAAYGEGHSLLINQVQRRHRATGLLCREIEAELSDLGVALARHIGGNGYLSPPHSQGFSIHYDPHDVFILQLEGRKHWRIYGRHVPFPTIPPPAPVPTEVAGKPRQEFILSPGELAYIPRGFLHEAHTSDSRSLHLTLSVETVTWLDLLSEMMVNDERFRRDLPSGLADRSKLGVDDRHALAELANALADGRGMRRALRKMAARLLANLDPLPNDGFRHVDDLASIQPDTWLALAPGAFGRVEIVGSRAILHLPGTALRAERLMAPAFRYLLRNRGVRARDLPLAVSLDQKLKFVRELVQGGHLVPMSGEQEMSLPPPSLGVE